MKQKIIPQNNSVKQKTSSVPFLTQENGDKKPNSIPVKANDKSVFDLQGLALTQNEIKATGKSKDKFWILVIKCMLQMPGWKT